MRPRPERQRKAAHKARKQLARAVHNARASRDAFLKYALVRWKATGRVPQVAVSKQLRRHQNVIRRALTVHGG